MKKNNENTLFILIVRISIVLVLIAACIMMDSCKSKEIIRYVPVIQKHDSIVYQTKHDTLLNYLPQKQSVITPNSSHLETDLAFSNASIDSKGLLHHSIENKGLIPGKVIDTKTTVHDSIPIPYPVNVPGKDVEVPVNVPVHDFIWWIGLIVFIGGIGFGLYKLFTKTKLGILIKTIFKNK